MFGHVHVLCHVGDVISNTSNSFLSSLISFLLFFPSLSTGTVVNIAAVNLPHFHSSRSNPEIEVSTCFTHCQLSNNLPNVLTNCKTQSVQHNITFNNNERRSFWSTYRQRKAQDDQNTGDTPWQHWRQVVSETSTGPVVVIAVIDDDILTESFSTTWTTTPATGLTFLPCHVYGSG